MDRYTKTVLTVIAACLVLLATKEVMIESVYAFTERDLNRCLDGARIEGQISGGNAWLRLRTDC